jgi:hypothetical protein
MLGVIYRCSRVQVNVAGLTQVHIYSQDDKQQQQHDASCSAEPVDGKESDQLPPQNEKEEMEKTPAVSALPVDLIGPLRPPDIENVDLSDLVSEHTDYCHKMKLILLRLNLMSHACQSPEETGTARGGDRGDKSKQSWQTVAEVHPGGQSSGEATGFTITPTKNPSGV